MIIHVEDLRFETIIGILDFERKTPQDVIVNLHITYDFKHKFIDYALVATVIKKRMKKKKYLLIEEALEDIAKKLKKKFPQISLLKIKITKPSILPDCKVSVEDSFHFDS